MTNWLDQLEVGPPGMAEGVAILPLKLPGDDIEIQTLSQAVEQGVAEVLESEAVNNLRVGYSSPIPVLIPYLQVVTGGKQDRMITIPIILSPAQTENEVRDIPVNCVEQGRWAFSRGEQQMSSRFSVHETIRMSPTMGFANLGASQEATWGSIRKYRAAKAWAVPQEVASSQSFAEMEEIAAKYVEERKTINEEIKGLLSRSTDLMANQTGIALFIGKELIGVELYGSSKLWEGQKEGVINSFISELSLHEKEEETPQESELEGILRKTLQGLALEKTKSVELGHLYLSKPRKDQDSSALLIEHHNRVVEFYYAKGQAELLSMEYEGVQRRAQTQEIIQQIVTPEGSVSELQRQEFEDEDIEDS
ncbi:MAG: ARPP-1 family domain-containing protein [Candidatus Hodarchaeota archaeon]